MQVVIQAALKLPDIHVLPSTTKVSPGVVVLIPTLPAESTVTLGELLILTFTLPPVGAFNEVLPELF